MKIVNPEYTVDRIVERMREASAQMLSTGAHGISLQARSNGETGYRPSLNIAPISFQSDFQSQDEYHVNDLVGFSDEHFVDNAYLALLKRAADPIGRSEFLTGLRSGELNKIDVLARLRYSKEGRVKGVRVKGLLAPAALRMLYRVPVAGYGLNLAVALLRLPSIVRNHRQFEAHMFAHEEIVVRHLNHVGQCLVNEAQALESAQRQLLARVNEENARIATEQANTHEILLGRVSEFSRYVEERINDEAAERRQELLQLEEQMSSLVREIQSRVQQLDAEYTQRFDRASEGISELAEGMNQLTREMNQLSEEMNRLNEGMNQLTREMNERRRQLTQLREELSSRQSEMADRLEHFQKRERLTSADVSLLSEKLRRLIEEPERRQLSPGLERQPIASDVHLLDKFFALFDEEFRGNRTAIKERLKPYLELLQGLDQARVVDIGSGRGEWLELLQEHGFQATGVDLNGVLVKACRERGLDVVEEDLFRYLSAQQDGSLGVLSAFHVVEHLSIEELVSFLNEAMRVLKPGGALMLETPNPQNVLVGSCNFYFDPTHRNPLPSEVLQLLVETRGFEAIKVLPLNPSEAEPVAGDSEIVSRFNQYFYGPMDYGLIAYRP